MQARVLVVEDDREIADLIRMYLERDGMQVICVDAAEPGLEAVSSRGIDLIVLDINLPGADGFEFLRQTRLQSNAPVIIVSARESDEDKIFGFGIGADDFVTKPFSPKVLVARVRTHIRRSQHREVGSDRQLRRFGPYVLDLDACILEVTGGGRIALAPKEFQLLRTLITESGRVFTPSQLYDEIWGYEFGDLSTVTVHIQRLRKKLEESGNPRFIETVRGVGYRFNEAGSEQA